MDIGPDDNTVSLRHDMRDATGGLLLAVLGISSPEGGYSRSRITDADNPSRVLALTAGQGVAIGTPPEGLQKMPVERIDVVDSPDMAPLHQVFGCVRRTDGNYWVP